MDIDTATKAFLALERIAVVGVSRTGQSPANHIAKRLRETGHQVFAVNPSGEVIDGEATYPSLKALPTPVQGAVVVTTPEQARLVARQGDAGERHPALHRQVEAGEARAEVEACIREASARDPYLGNSPAAVVWEGFQAEPFVLTGGGPGNATTFLSQYLTQKAVGQFDLGPAAAFSIEGTVSLMRM